MKKLITILTLALGLAVTNAQVTIPTNAPTFPSNQLQQVVGLSAVSEFALSLLPYWDKTLTNSFNAGEIELELGPAWKSVSASGATPYLSIGGEYWLTKILGVGANAITLGNGTGSSQIDSAHVISLLRKDKGNVAGHILLGGGRDFSHNRYNAEFGLGFEFRWLTGVGMKVETRYLRYIEKQIGQPDHDFLTQAAITTHF